MAEPLDRFKCSHCLGMFTADRPRHEHEVYYPGYGDTLTRSFTPEVLDLVAVVADLIARIERLEVKDD